MLMTFRTCMLIVNPRLRAGDFELTYLEEAAASTG